MQNTNHPEHTLDILVCGAHMSGLALNVQLTERAAIFAERVQTAACYQLYALPGGPPYRPGLIRVNEGGVSIEAELWRLPAQNWGDFIALIPSPLGIGTVQLSDGRSVKGFICEGIAVQGAKNISALGSWRNFLKTL
jgi:allophanate hydrolase